MSESRGSLKQDFLNSVQAGFTSVPFGQYFNSKENSFTGLAYFGGGTLSISKSLGSVVVATNPAAAKETLMSLESGYCRLVLMLVVAGHSSSKCSRGGGKREGSVDASMFASVGVVSMYDRKVRWCSRTTKACDLGLPVKNYHRENGNAHSSLKKKKN